MKKLYGFLLVCVCFSMILFGCSNKDKKEKKLDHPYYGNELYNAVYVGVEGFETTHIIPLMSTRDIAKAREIQVEASGGTFHYRYAVESTDYTLGEYKLFRIVLIFDTILFEKDLLDIKSIRIVYDNSNIDELLLDRCQIVKTEGILRNETLNINGTPLRMPGDMHELPLEMSAEDELTITNIRLTNDGMKLGPFRENYGEKKDSFFDLILSDSSGMVTWSAEFELKADELSTYKHWGTSIIIEYTYQGESYYSLPAISRTIYNPFDTGFDGIERYFEYLKQ